MPTTEVPCEVLHEAVAIRRLSHVSLLDTMGDLVDGMFTDDGTAHFEQLGSSTS